MVIRLFVPPGEGQHKLVPKRPDPLGANATLQYSLLSSTFLAATYASFAARYKQRVTPSQSISATALFIRSSARLGLWAGAIGAALNVYYYTSFTNIVVLQKNPKVKPWRFYKWTKRFTVEDGALLGAGLGLAASIPTIIMRRPAIPVWTRCFGLTNIGASAGVLGAHAYLQYTGERQRAYQRLDRRLKRRSLEFWAIFWDKKLMALFDPIIQQYVRHNGIWYTQLLPESVYEQPDDYGGKSGKEDQPAASQEQEETAYYTQPYDYLADLKQINVDTTYAEMEELLAEKEAYLRDAEYMLFINSQKQHDYCHFTPEDPDERQHRLHEIHLIEIAYNRLRSAAHNIDVKLAKWKMSLQHKAIWCAEDRKPASVDELKEWFPTSDMVDFDSHSPTLSLAEMEKFQSQIGAEVKRFEELVVDYGYSQQKRDRWKKDLDDGRGLLRAADRIVFELQKIKENVESAGTEAKAKAEDKEKEKQKAAQKQIEGKGNAHVAFEQAVNKVDGEQQQQQQEKPSTPRKQKMDASPSSEEKKVEKTQVDKEKADKSDDGGLDSNQS